MFDDDDTINDEGYANPRPTLTPVSAWGTSYERGPA